MSNLSSYNKLKKRKCPICNSTRTNEVKEGETILFHCKKCGFLNKKNGKIQ